jgi:hypothetical protein
MAEVIAKKGRGYNFRVKLESTRLLFAGSRASEKAWKDAWTAAGQVAARKWIDEFLELHFEPGNSQRYRLAARNPSWQRKKARGRAYVRRGVWVSIPTPPVALVWKGQLKNRVLSNRRTLQIQSIARMWKGAPHFRVKVPVPIPHPLNPKNKGEVTRMIASETRLLQRLTFREFKKQTKQIRQKVTVKVAGG